MKVTKRIFFSAIVVLLILLLLFVQQKRCYRLPAGYASAVEAWREKGLVPEGRRAEGSQEFPYDVVVWGTDPEGIAAALAAARNGLCTLLVDDRDRVGGLFVLGQLNFLDMNYQKGILRRKLLTRGIFEEFFIKVGGTTFDLDRGLEVFQEMLAGEERLTLRLNTRLSGTLQEGERLLALVVEEAGKPREIYGRVFIDASQDADLAYLAGVPFTEGFADIGLPGKFQACTLVFSLEGVNWYRVMWENLVRDRRKSSAATLRAAWGYDQYARAYVPENDRIDFRGLNMVRQRDGRVFVNALLIYNVDTSDPKAKAQAMAEAKEEAELFVAYARENFPGFARARICGFAKELYVRQSRHMQALYRLTIDDVLENRDHWDSVGYGSYPVDIQAIDRNFPGVVLGAPERYSVPFRSLVPPNLSNLLVAGRSSGYDSLAHGSARVVPVGMVGAQAAGVAAAYAVATGDDFRKIARDKEAIAFIRRILAGQGALVETGAADRQKESSHPSYPAVQALRRLGLVAGGYDNSYLLDEPLKAQAFLNLLFHGAYRTLNLAGRPKEADRLYYVMAETNNVVTTANITALLQLFYRFNPHLPVMLDGYWLSGGEETGDRDLPRGLLYEAVAGYLESIAK